MKTAKVVGFGALAVCIFGAGTLFTRTTVAHADTPNGDQLAIQNVISQGLNDYYHMPIVSDDSFAKLMSSTASVSGDASNNIYTKEYSEHKAIYTSQALSLKSTQIQQMLKTLKTGNFRGLDGWAKNITYNQMSITGTTANVIGVADVSSTFQEKVNGQWKTFSPQNKIIFNDSLTKDASGQWKISNEQVDFVPGYAP